MSEQNQDADSANLSGGSAGAGGVADMADAEIVDSGDAWLNRVPYVIVDGKQRLLDQEGSK